MNKKYIIIISTLVIGIALGQFIASLDYNIFLKKENEMIEYKNEIGNNDNETNENSDTVKESQSKVEVKVEELPEQEDKYQKSPQEIIAESQIKEKERRKNFENLEKAEEKKQEEKNMQEENSSYENTSINKNSGIRRETNTERLAEPKAPDRDFAIIRESKNASLYFEKGYKENEIEEILQYYEEEVYPDLTGYYNIDQPRDVKFYFLSKKSNIGINAPLPTTVSDPSGFYSYGHIYIFPDEIMHNMKRIVRHEYTHHLNNHYYDGGIAMYMNEGMAYYIMNYYYLNENQKNTVANVYGVKSDYKTYHNSKYVFLVLDRVLKGDSNFPEYFKNLKDYNHDEAFEMTFGMTESEFEKVYNEYVK